MKHAIRWLEDIRLKDWLLVGQKCASLGELLSFDVRIPLGFCVTTEAYKEFIESSELQPVIDNLLINVNPNDSVSLESSEVNIKLCISKAKIPEHITREVWEAYRQLSYRCNEDAVTVSVRSSGTAEDRQDDSFAGQYATFLNVSGAENVMTRVKECWASIYLKRAIYYRAKRKCKHASHFMAVLIQQMISPQVSGVMFTESPGKSTEMLLNSIWGLCEPLVSGRVTSDYYSVSKDKLKLVDQHLETKECMTICNPGGGVQDVHVPNEKKNVSSLTNGQIKMLVEIGKKIENHFGSPQDIEWAFLNGKIVVLQSRPITSLQHVKPLTTFPIKWETESDKQIVWTRGTGVPARFVDPVTPLSFDLVKAILACCWEDAMKKLPIPYNVGPVQFRLFNSYLYWNIDLEERPKFSLRLLNFLLKLWMAVRTGIDNWKRYLPTYMSEVEDLKRFDVESASPDELFTHFEKICDIFSEYFVWEVYLGETIDAFFGIYLDVISRLTGASKLEAAKLVQGMDSKTKEMNKELWKLINKASKTPFIRDTILNEFEFDNAIKKLQESHVGSEFIRYFSDFLEEYGHRSPKADWFFPSWKEDPSLALNYMREQLDREDYDFERIPKKQAQERDILTSRLYNSIKQNPVKRALFQQFLKAARRWAPMREDRQHYVKLTSQLLKDTLKELNKRLTEKDIVCEPNDIFFLTLSELSEIREDLSKGKPLSFKDIVSKRRNHWRKSFELTPPPKIAGPLVMDHVTTMGKRLTGIPASPGRVMGKARVISNPDEFKNFRHGEILVTPETGPEWILLFGLAKAIVTDYGMPLSHSALLSREFGIPAVCGTKIATGIIRTGQMVIVDGNNGVVVTI